MGFEARLSYIEVSNSGSAQNILHTGSRLDNIARTLMLRKARSKVGSNAYRN
jgi:hypothetical protein